MSRDSETIRQLCVSLEAMTNERDQALIRAERAESITNDVPEEVGRLLKEVRDVTAQRDKAWDDLDTFADVKIERDKACAALEQVQLLRVAADDALSRLVATHEAVTEERDKAMVERDGLRASFVEERERSHKAESMFVEVLRKLCEQMGADEFAAPGAALQVILDERDSLRTQLDQARSERDEAVDGYDRVRSMHEVMCDEAELRDGLATLIDETFGLKSEPTPNALLTALKEGIRRLSTEDEAIRAHLDGVVSNTNCSVAVDLDSDNGSKVWFLSDEYGLRLAAPVGRVLNMLSGTHPAAIVAAADRLRAVPVRGLQPDSPAALAAVLNAIATTHPEKLLEEFVEAYPEKIIAAADKLRPVPSITYETTSTKPLADVRASDVPRGMSPDDAALEHTGMKFADALAAEDELKGVGCKVRVYTDPNRAYPGPRLVLSEETWLWCALPHALAEIARREPAALLAAADRLRATAQLDASGEIDRHRPETTEIMGEWDGDSIVSPGGYRGRVVRVSGFAGLSINDNWMDARNAVALLDRAGLLPKATLDKETLAKAALFDWTVDGNRHVDCDLYGKYTAYEHNQSLWSGEPRGTVVQLCARLGIKVEP